MLYIIGLGLDKGDLTLKALDALKKCKIVYLETYTSYSPYTIKELEKFLEKDMIKADREMIEQKAEIILKEAKKQNIALLVSGSPLTATTHTDLILRARKLGIKVHVIHGISVLNAISDTGLHVYKFGKTASIPKSQENYKPESFYDIIMENLAINAHTLMLLDIGLEVHDALLNVKEIASKRGEDISNMNFVVCSRLGTYKQDIKTGKINELLKEKFELPACIIALAPLHFMEAEMLGIKQEEKKHDGKKDDNKV